MSDRCLFLSTVETSTKENIYIIKLQNVTVGVSTNFTTRHRRTIMDFFMYNPAFRIWSVFLNFNSAQDRDASNPLRATSLMQTTAYPQLEDSSTSTV